MKEIFYETALDKYNNNQPPTDDCMKRFETIIRLEEQRNEYISRRKLVVLEKVNRSNVIPNRKGPPKRYNEYEDDKTGLKKSYGKYSPFFAYPDPPNMRHYKNITIKNIK